MGGRWVRIERSSDFVDVVVGIVIGIERAINGFTTFVETRFAGELDGDPSHYHSCYRYHCARYRPHSSLFFFFFFWFLFCLSVRSSIRGGQLGSELSVLSSNWAHFGCSYWASPTTPPVFLFYFLNIKLPK